jgi:ketosteroid isomerase-like protein
MATLCSANCVEAQIEQLLDQREYAIRAADLDAIMENYATDVVCFDSRRPCAVMGAHALRRDWQRRLARLPDRFEVETRDLRIIVNGELALAHWRWRVVQPDGNPFLLEAWRQNSVVCEWAGDGWRIVHEHCSEVGDQQVAAR